MPITLDGTNGITTPTYGGADTSEYLVPVTAFKNRIINGAMVIDQRNAGASVTVNSAAAFYATDRFRFSGEASDGVFTGQQISDAPTGFVNSLRVTTTTADTSIGAGQVYYAVQNIEGFNTADLMWGTANAQTVTLSFWTKSSLTGTFGGALSNNAVDRSYPFSYTISSANTWEYKTITVAGDTTGTWLTNNSTGIRVYFGLGAGSNFTSAAGSWAAAQRISATGAVSVIGTLNATWQITGVQLEVGSTATSFDYRPNELALCQRYYYMLLSGNASGAGQPIGIASRTSATQINACIPFPVTMRTAPTLVQNTGTSYYQLYLSTGVNNIDSFKVDQVSTTNYLITNNSALSGMTVGQAGVLYSNNASGYIAFTSEL